MVTIGSMKGIKMMGQDANLAETCFLTCSVDCRAPSFHHVLDGQIGYGSSFRFFLLWVFNDCRQWVLKVLQLSRVKFSLT